MFGSADPSRVRTQRIQLPSQWTSQEGIVESPPWTLKYPSLQRIRNWSKGWKQQWTSTARFVHLNLQWVTAVTFFLKKNIIIWADDKIMNAQYWDNSPQWDYWSIRLRPTPTHWQVPPQWTTQKCQRLDNICQNIRCVELLYLFRLFIPDITTGVHISLIVPS